LLYPGLQDITAWVDYTLLRRLPRGRFHAVGLHDAEFFLAGLRVDHEMKSWPTAMTLDCTLGQSSATADVPGEMGERFKAMGVVAGLGSALAGFCLADCATRCEYQRAGGVASGSMRSQYRKP